MLIILALKLNKIVFPIFLRFGNTQGGNGFGVARVAVALVGNTQPF
jgi:hypothetical protein